MPRGPEPPLEPGERRVILVRQHPWALVRAAWTLAALALAPVLYAALDEALPAWRLAGSFAPFLWAVLTAAALCLAKWLLVDLLPWSRRFWLLTDRRVIAQSGVLAVHRRECSLLKIQESDFASKGLMARLLDFGDVTVETSGALGLIVLREIRHPARVQALLSAQSRALREDVARRRLAEAPSEIMRQLETIVHGLPDPHAAQTEAMRPVTARAARAQRRLSLLPDEAVVAVVRQHGIVLAGALVAPVAAVVLLAAAVILLGLGGVFTALVAAAAAVPWALWRLWIFRAHEYVLTTERLMELRDTPLLSQTRDIVQLASVQDIALEIPTLFGRLADIGNVVVEVAGAAERVTLKNVGRPDEVQRLIFETIDARQRGESEREDQRLVSTLRHWFSEYHKLQQGGPP